MHETREMRIRRCTRWVAPLITMFFFLFVSVSALAAPASEERLSDPFLEKRVQGLEKHLRCMICDGQALAESDASMVADMRRFSAETCASDGGRTGRRRLSDPRYAGMAFHATSTIQGVRHGSFRGSHGYHDK